MIPGGPSLVFLFVLLVFLPATAIRSARRLAAAGTGTTSTAEFRTRVWAGTIITQCAVFALAWFTARSFGYNIFEFEAIRLYDVLAAAAALSACLLLRQVGRAFHSDDDRRSLVVNRIVPQGPGEWALWSGAVLVASVAEEAAYRGVAMTVLYYALGDPWIAGFISSLAFAGAHALQGWKSAVVLFYIATVLHALVVLTGTLITAMVVHAAYDFISGSLVARDSARQLR